MNHRIAAIANRISFRERLSLALIHLRAERVSGYSTFGSRNHRCRGLRYVGGAGEQFRKAARPRGRTDVGGILPDLANRRIVGIAALEFQHVVTLAHLSEVAAGSVHAWVDAGLKPGAARLPRRATVGRSGAVAVAALAEIVRAYLTGLAGRASSGRTAANALGSESQRNVQPLCFHFRHPMR